MNTIPREQAEKWGYLPPEVLATWPVPLPLDPVEPVAVGHGAAGEDHGADVNSQDANQPPSTHYTSAASSVADQAAGSGDEREQEMTTGQLRGRLMLMSACLHGLPGAEGRSGKEKSALLELASRKAGLDNPAVADLLR